MNILNRACQTLLLFIAQFRRRDKNVIVRRHATYWPIFRVTFDLEVIIDKVIASHEVSDIGVIDHLLDLDPTPGLEEAGNLLERPVLGFRYFEEDEGGETDHQEHEEDERELLDGSL